MARANDKPAEQPEKVTGLALERALRRSIAAGCLGWTYFRLASGIFLTSFGKMLRLTKFQFGLLGSLPRIVFPAQLYGSLLVERLGHRKRFFTLTFSLSRLLWLGVVLIPFVVAPDHRALRTGLFLGLLLVSNTLLAMGLPVWMSWLGDLVPEGRRGRFWARRNALTAAAPVLPVMAFSLLFDHLRGQGHEVWAYVIIFGFAVLVGQIDLWIHYGIPEPKMKRAEGPPSLRRLLSEPLRQRNFRRFLYYVGVTTFSMAFLGQFTFLYLLDVLEGVQIRIPLGFTTLRLRTYGFLGAMGVANVILGLLLSRTWGYLIDRFGNKPLLRLLTLVLVPLPLAWLFVTPAHPFAMTIPIFLIASVVYMAKQYLIQNVLYAITPQANRTMYAAVYGVTFSIFGAVSPILAGLLMHSLGDFSTTVAGIHVEPFHVLCFITVGVRVVEQYFLGGFREPRSASAGSLIRRLVQANPFAVLPRAFSLATSARAHQRAKAVRGLGHTGSQLVTRELVDLLDDPSPEVRHQAALALGHTKDREAVGPLIERLADGDAETRRQAAWALGQLGAAKATVRLIALLADPYPHVRSAAALALGELGGRQATAALMAFLAEEIEPVEFASAATALGLLGEPAALDPILSRMHAAQQPVFRRQLAVALGDLLGPRHTFYTYLDEETRVRGRRVARSCRAVGRALRRPLGPHQPPGRLGALAGRIEEAYHDGDWAACARHLADLAEQLVPAPETRIDEHDLPARYLLWLGQRPDPPSDDAGFEQCVLGVFALEHLVKSL